MATSPLKIVLVAGLPGSGKTEASKHLAGATDWRAVDKDELTREATERALLAAGAHPDDRESSFYLSAVRPAEYEALLAEGFAEVERGRSVILDAPFLVEVTDRAWMVGFRDAAAVLGATCELVWVSCDAATTLARLRSRQATRDQWKLANFDQWWAQVGELAPVGDVMRLHVVDSRSDFVQRVLAAALDIADPDHAAVSTVPSGRGVRRRWRR